MLSADNSSFLQDFETLPHRNMTEKRQYIAKTFFGLEDLLVQELSDLGASDIEKGSRAVSFKGDQKLLYKANLCLRTAIRILQPITTFKANNENQLYRRIQDINWGDFLPTSGTFAIDSVVKSDIFTHSKYVALKSKDAIVDQFREIFGFRPSVDVEQPDIRINIRLLGNECDVSLDSSGDSLHKRGYRTQVNLAPLNEVLAAGLVMLSGWDRQSNFVDFMCGSGTLLIEAAMYANNMAPNKFRERFGFMTWLDFDKALWEEVKQEALDAETMFEHHIIGSDISRRTVEIATENIENAGVDEYIRISPKHFADRLAPKGNPGTVIINPPYGERMNRQDVDNLYRQIGDHLKYAFDGYDAWIFSSNKEALKKVGLRTSRKMMLYNGALECKFHKYEMYRGSKRS